MNTPYRGLPPLRGIITGQKLRKEECRRLCWSALEVYGLPPPEVYAPPAPPNIFMPPQGASYQQVPRMDNDLHCMHPGLNLPFLP
jgi:hypothetical protein